MLQWLDDFFCALEGKTTSVERTGLSGTSGERMRQFFAVNGLDGWKDDKEKFKLDLINDIKTFLFGKWEKPWQASVLFDANGKVISGFYNIHGRGYYDRANLLSLAMNAGESPFFITGAQIAKQGGTVKDAKKWVGIISFIPIADDDNKDKIKFMLPKSHSVINVDYVDGIKKPIFKPVEFEKKELNQYIEAFIAELVKRKRVPKLHYDQANRCYYKHTIDYSRESIHMVNINQFKEIDKYYSVLFHEITHSTKNPDRCGRGKNATNLAYANEELVAEMGAMILCSEMGLEYTRQNSLSYLKGWLKGVKGDADEAMLEAYSYACDAAEYLLADIDLASLVPQSMSDRANNVVTESEKATEEKPSKEASPKVTAEETSKDQPIKKGTIAFVAKFYADTTVGTKGTVLKSWTEPKGTVWVKLYFGKNQTGQRLAKSFPLDVLSFSEPTEKTSDEPAEKVPAENTSTRKAILDIPVSDILTDEKRFQNRANAYSEDSANRIIKAVENGTFDWAKFDPITIWYDVTRMKMLVLSGHSRLAAFKTLAKTNKEFERIPAVHFKGSEKEAIDLALNSNTLSTKETDAERAGYYHRMRQQCEVGNLKGLGAARTDCDKQVEAKCRDAEGKNANFILNLSYLAPRGFLMDSLHATGMERDNDSTNVLRTVANWIGEARRSFPQISDVHETEIAKWLLNGAYGSKAGQFRKKQDFLERVRVALSKFKGGADDSINIAQNVGKTSFEKEWEKRLDAAKLELAEAEKDHAERYAKYLDAVMHGSITNERMLELMKPLTANVAKLREAVDAIKKQHGLMREAEGRQKSLFGLAPLGTAKRAKTSRLKGDIGAFLGEYDRHCYTIALKGDKGAGKSRLMFQLVNAYAGARLKCAILSLEMSPESSVIQNYADAYIEPKNKAQIAITGESQDYASLSKICAMYDVVAIDSWNKVRGAVQTDFDRLQKEHPQCIIISIFQSTTGKVTRGGNMVEYDAGTVIQVNKGGHAVCEKNRYASTDLVYNVFDKQLEKEVNDV